MRVYQKADGIVKTATIHQSDKIPMLISASTPAQPIRGSSQKKDC